MKHQQIKLKKIKSINCVIISLIFILLINLTSAAPPTLPVLIIGKVIDKQGKAIPEAPISITWTDYNNKVHITKSKTLTNEQAIVLGDPNLVGFYRFLDGSIKAADGTTIKINSLGTEIELPVEKGIILKAPDIVAAPEDQDKNIFEKMFGYIKNLFTKKEAVPTEYWETQGPGTDENPLLNDTNLTQSNSETNGEEAIVNEDLTDALETGKGDSDLGEGPNSDATISDNSPISKSEERSEKYTENIDISQSEEPKGKSAILASFYSVFSFKDEKGLYILLSSLAVLGVIIFIIITITIRKLIKKYSKKIGKLKSIKQIEDLKAVKFMNLDFHTLKPDNSVIDAIEIFANSDINIIPVISVGSAAGTVRKQDILKLDSFDYNFLLQTKIKDIMKKRFASCNPDKNLKEVYKTLLNSISDTIIIKDKYNFIGTINYFDILNVFNKADFIISNPPLLGSAVKKSFKKIDPESSLYKIKNKFVREDADYVVIIKDKEPLGIITTKDLIIAIRKNLNFQKTTARQIMSSDMLTLTPGTSIYKTFGIVLSNRYNQIPIVENKIATGIVTIKNLTKIYYDLLTDVLKKTE